MLVKIIDNFINPPIVENLALINNDVVQVKLYYGNQKTFPDDLSSYYAFLSDQELVRSKRFIKKSDERTYIISHALVNKKISELLGLDFNDLKIKYFDNKKPYVEQSNLDFNLSHSSDYFAFIISVYENIFVGVDIEVVRENLEIEPIVNNYFHENEIRYILNSELNHRTQYQKFYEVWTRKEAFFKMLGSGITEELSKINLSSGEREINIQNNSSFNKGNFSEVYIYTNAISSHLVLSVSANFPVFIIPEQVDGL